MTGVQTTTISFPHSLNVSTETKKGARAKERSNERAVGNERHALSSESGLSLDNRPDEKARREEHQVRR